MQLLFLSHSVRRKFSINNVIQNKSWKVLFFGNDEFSLYSFKILHENLQNKGVIGHLDVCTTFSSPSNLVYKFAVKNRIIITPWPPNLKNAYYDLGVVVSFGHLIPKKIIDHFPLGMVNVHASLLPQWRGASPIIHSILNGDTETGVSVMRINPYHFDTGNIILQKSCAIGTDEMMPSLHERLGKLGATCLMETITTLPESLDRSVPQNNDSVSYAPRINARIALVEWNKKSSREIYNMYRALFSLYELRTNWHNMAVKLRTLRLASEDEGIVENKNPGRIMWNRAEKKLSVCCLAGTVIVDVLSIGGKSLRAIDFYNGYLSKKSEVHWFFK